MPIYRKCRSCADTGNCLIQRRLGDAIKGLGVTSITHRCGSWRPLVDVGQNVWVLVKEAPYGEEDAYYGGSPSSYVFPGAFAGFSKKFGRCLVWVPQGAKSKCGQSEFSPLEKNSYDEDGAFCRVGFSVEAIRKGDAFANFGASRIVGLRQGTTDIAAIEARRWGSPMDDVA